MNDTLPLCIDDVSDEFLAGLIRDGRVVQTDIKTWERIKPMLAAANNLGYEAYIDGDRVEIHPWIAS